MTYLATEMLLYLLATTVVGLALGWLIFGAGRRRKLDALRTGLVKVIEQEKEAHHQTRLSLDSAEDRSAKAIEAAKADAGHSLAELRDNLDAERASAKENQTALEQIRANMEQAVQEGRQSGQAAVDQAMATTKAERAIASEALAREAQSRAQLEELRLLIGAEKLAAESARTELAEVRASMQATLETERSAHQQATSALNDIRSALARTLGAGALDLGGDDLRAPAAPSSSRSIGSGYAGDVDRMDGMTGPLAGAGVTTAFSMMTDMAAAGDALNNPDLHEADIEDREGVGLDLSSTIEKNSMPVEPHEEGDDEADEEGDEADDPGSTSTLDPIAFRTPPLEPVEGQRPAAFLDERPDDADDLQAIDGIGPEIESDLHESGCYCFGQLADLTSEDVAWLAREIGLGSDQITTERWIEQAKSLRSEADRGLAELAEQQNATG